MDEHYQKEYSALRTQLKDMEQSYRNLEFEFMNGIKDEQSKYRRLEEDFKDLSRDFSQKDQVILF